jgi:D-sedoheptulose 7-phosphate isomerase
MERIQEAIAIKQAMLADAALIESVARVVEDCTAALASGGKLLFAGNGGSAADAQHLAAEMVGRFELDRAALPAIALTTDTSLLTAVANDFGYQQVFARQVEGLGCKGDVFFGISTSGNSANVLRALSVAREREMVTVGMTGSGESEIRRLADHCLCVPSRSTARIQEAHILLGHIVCEQVEANLQN